MLSTEKMRDISVDPVTRTAVCQPGLFNAEVKKAAAEHGLWYPPDPSSYEICSIGGNIATNAGGLCCVKYGVTTDYVLGMQVVLADGTAVRLGGPRLKDVAGLSLTKLFVGSEGTLGIVTEVTLRLLPPQNASSVVVASFASVQAAVDAVLGVSARLRPSMLEFMDSVAINAVEDTLRMGLDRGPRPQCWPAPTSAGGRAETPNYCRRCSRERCDGSVFHRLTPTRVRRSSSARRFCIPAVGAEGRCCSKTSGSRCPAPALVDGIAGIAGRRDITVALIAHAGDGNTHPLIVFDPADHAMAARAELAFGEIMELAISLDGTITGEHGVGRLKRPWLASQLGPDAMGCNRRIKHALDPLGILQPGRGDLALCALTPSVKLVSRSSANVKLVSRWALTLVDILPHIVVLMRHDCRCVSPRPGDVPAGHRRNLAESVADVPRAARPRPRAPRRPRRSIPKTITTCCPGTPTSGRRPATTKRSPPRRG